MQSCSDYVRQKAQEAIKKRPVATEVRTPNNQWVGLGFSQSMPGNEIKKLGKEKYKNQLETAYEVGEIEINLIFPKHILQEYFITAWLWGTC